MMRELGQRNGKIRRPGWEIREHKNPIWPHCFSIASNILSRRLSGGFKLRTYISLSLNDRAAFFDHLTCLCYCTLVAAVAVFWLLHFIALGVFLFVLPSPQPSSQTLAWVCLIRLLISMSIRGYETWKARSGRRKVADIC